MEYAAIFLFSTETSSTLRYPDNRTFRSFAYSVPVVLNPSDYKEHSSGQGKEECCYVAAGDGEAGPLDDLTEVVGSGDVVEESPTRDRVNLKFDTDNKTHPWDPIPKVDTFLLVSTPSSDEDRSFLSRLSESKLMRNPVTKSASPEKAHIAPVTHFQAWVIVIKIK